MQLSKASIRYARALYSLAEEMQVSREVYRDIHFLMDFFSEAKDVRHLMANPVIPPHIKKKAVRMIFEGHVTDLTIRFLDLVIGKNRVTDIYGIVREYIELYRDNKGIVRAVVRSAVPLSDEEKAGFSDWLSRNFPGKEVEIVNKVQPSLIGGFTLRVDGVYVDKSVAGRLHSLRKELNVKVYQKK